MDVNDIWMVDDRTVLIRGSFGGFILVITRFMLILKRHKYRVAMYKRDRFFQDFIEMEGERRKTECSFRPFILP